jgi:hypothetical protein
LRVAGQGVAHYRIDGLDMKPGDRVIWLYSRKRSFMAGRGVERVPGVIVRVCRRRIRLKVRLLRADKLVNVSPDNVICEEDCEPKDCTEDSENRMGWIIGSLE